MDTALKNNIISQLGLNSLSVPKQADLLIRMAEVIRKRLALRVMKLLSEPALNEYLKIADNDEISGHQFLTEKIPNYSAIIEEEIAKFKREIAS